MNISSDLVDLYLKYNTPSPRYNSYPSIPYWNTPPSTEEWILSCEQSLQKNNNIGLYIHLPFCENHCSFCVCNTYITQDHSIEEIYIEAIQKEFTLYCQKLPQLKNSSLEYLYLGGGTPNFFSPKNLERLLSPILAYFTFSPHHIFSTEADIRYLKEGHLEILYQLGFREIRFGFEDSNPTVQQTINKKQTIEQAKVVFQKARKIGYNSIGLDLIYGLPHQNIQSITESMQKVMTLKADRLSFYGYIHIPRTQSNQCFLHETHLPQAKDRIRLYLQGRKLIEEAHYQEIGMDQYALEHDIFWKSKKEKRLRRSFVGYTQQKIDLFLGIGTSAISESIHHYHQNEKILKKYQKEMQNQTISQYKGHTRSIKDKNTFKVMESLATNWEAELSKEIQKETYFQSDFFKLAEDANLLQIKNNYLKILPPGRPLLRKICMSLDHYMNKKPN